MSTCQIMMSTCQIMMSTCQIMKSTCQIFMLISHILCRLVRKSEKNGQEHVFTIYVQTNDEKMTSQHNDLTRRHKDLTSQHTMYLSDK